ncbi:hypothetical protein [Phenylobacterium kunshanense]|uniref:Uncharacterized protein n=1 Tax=Phenylobacterium kunshanense TaxID=1445034 RepID=A0A328B759_9CAUL|nr:hypothetical protein [Phenylobacterium kunshanense]RAK62475.1 hypothetical protein DJ019_18815 [Phenylobacterium kunshanense]
MGKSTDRTYRSLRGLEKTASTSRVLNLAALAARNADNPEHEASPFFVAQTLNGSVIVRHRLRDSEREAFDRLRYTATKLIIPFERSDLGLGGRSLFVNERGWLDIFEELRGDYPDFPRDVAVLEAIDELPSLDPFLLREHMKRRGFDISPSHFEISAPDLAKMQRFVGSEIAKLIELAYRDVDGMEGNVARLVEALLSARTDERLEPLRLTLRLEREHYREGIFAWKGFLYYKWVLNSLWADIRQVFSELNKVKVIGPVDAETAQELEQLKQRLRQKMERQVKTVMNQLGVYDQVFSQLTGEGNAPAFRDFLLKSPEMFLSLGEGCGLVSHIATYWRYQFPRGRPLAANVMQLMDVLQDFELSLGADTDHEYLT